MSRLTITLSEARYRALKEASAQRDKTIGQLIDESLDFYGIKSRDDARDLVRRARSRSKLTDKQAVAVAEEQVKVLRKLHGLTVAEIELMLTDLVQNAIMLEPVEAPSAPDPGDQLLWNLLAARSSLVLVTGDKRLLRDVGMRGRVISPAAFVSDSDLADSEA